LLRKSESLLSVATNAGWKMSVVVIFGGTGFIDRRLVHRIAAEGTPVRVAVRHPNGGRSTLRAADLDQITFVRADVRDQTSVAAAIEGADAVINAVSTYVEKGGVTFESVHVQGAEAVAREAVRLGIARLVLISGLGADPQSRSPYIRSRGRGELAVQQAFPVATIVRPSAMFGPGDALFGTLADLARLLPVLPLIGGGHTRLQPVYVEDVAEAVARMLGDPGTIGRTYELAGRGVYTLRDLIGFTLRVVGKRRLLIPVPFAGPRSRPGCWSSCQARRSPPAKLTFSRRTAWRAEPCRVSRSSISGPKPSKMWCRPISACRRHRGSTDHPARGPNHQAE
jgi:uncharacterized protein YbjT (DUF2867 family)